MGLLSRLFRSRPRPAGGGKYQPHQGQQERLRRMLGGFHRLPAGTCKRDYTEHLNPRTRRT